MDFEHGLLMFFIGTTATITGFFIAFMVVNHIKKKELDYLREGGDLFEPDFDLDD